MQVIHGQNVFSGGMLFQDLLLSRFLSNKELHTSNLTIDTSLNSCRL